MRVARAKVVLLVEAAVVVLGGCVGGPDEPDAGRDGGPVDAGPDLGLVPGAVRLESGANLDLSVDGARVVLLARSLPTTSPIDGAGPASLAISDDGATSFRTIRVEEAHFEGLEPFAVHAARGRVWLLLADRMFDTTVVVREVDLEAATLGTPASLDVFDLHFGPDAITGFSIRGVSAPMARSVRFDLASGEVTRREMPGGAPCDGLQDPLLYSADGETFLRVCYRHYERCVQRGRVSSGALEEVCTDWHDWPIPWAEGQRDELVAGTVQRIFNDAGHVRARALLTTGDAPGLGPEADLGAGFLESGGVHTHFEDVIFLAEDTSNGGGRRRVATIRDGALVPLPFPELPCGDAELCQAATSSRSFAALQAAAPLGGGAWLGVYAVYAGAIAVVVQEGAGTPTPFDPRPEDATPGAGSLAVPWQPGDSPLEEACALAVSCAGGLSTQITNCIAYWERVRSTDPDDDAAYERFIGTPDGDCAALADTFPARFATDCTARCLPDGRSIECGRELLPTDSFHEVRECAALGGTCVVTGTRAGCTVAGASCDACTADGTAAICDASGAPDLVDACAARGEACYSGGAGATGCRREPVDTRAARCEGSVHVTHGASAVETLRRDCGRSHLPCQADGGCTWEGILFGGFCTGGGPSGCDGTHLTWCAGGFVRFVDCLDVGGTGCADGRCVIP